MIMGNDLSTARIAATGAFVVNFGAQIYGIVSKPSMKDIADKYHYAFSPNPYFIGGFFFPQMILQAAWIRKLYTGEVDQSQLNYVPIYVLGNLCISGWMIFWNREQFGWSQLLVCVNSFAHLYAVTQLPAISERTALTHWVVKTTAGIGLLDLIDNGGVFLRLAAPPTPLVQILTGGFFAVASGFSDLILGSCVVYDAIALWSGQQGDWSSTLGWFALGSAAVVGVKNLLF